MDFEIKTVAIDFKGKKNNNF